MAKPRVFVSSTFYDLKHIRSSLEHFIESLGYEAILSEEGNIPYRPDRPLDESCYLEAEHADIFVLIVGGRYGSAASEEKKRKLTSEKDAHKTNDFYTSITRREYEKASNNIPTYILIDKNVYAEYFTYLMNKNNNTTYAHVDSVNIFHFIDFIKSKPLNNPVQTFDKHTDIQNWLREQGAGLFRDLLHEQSTRSRFTNLEDQINKLSTISDTLKIYLESLIKNSNNKEATKIIDTENKKIIEKLVNTFIESEPLLFNTKTVNKITNTEIVDSITKKNSIREVLSSTGIQIDFFRRLPPVIQENFVRSVNEIRQIYKCPPLAFETS